MSDKAEIVISCANCFFRQEETIRVGSNIQTQKVAFCHRYPPTIPSPGTNIPYPIVGIKDWCGEFMVDDGKRDVIKQEDLGQTVQEHLNETNPSGIIIPGSPR